jgi:RNA polymerase sigma-70 factor (ECF subfamily)
VAGELTRERFREVFEAERASLYRFACRLTRDATDAEDLLQESFLTVWRKRDQYRGNGSVGGYLKQTAYRLFLNARERAARRARLAPPPVVATAPAAASDAAAAEQRRAAQAHVESALAALPAEQRDAFVLFRFEGLTCPEIAALTETHVKTVETRVRRATLALAERLRAHREALVDG